MMDKNQVTREVKLCIIRLLSETLRLQSMKTLKKTLNSIRPYDNCKLSERELLSNNPDSLVLHRSRHRDKKRRLSNRTVKNYAGRNKSETAPETLCKEITGFEFGKHHSADEDDDDILLRVFKYYASFDLPFQFNKLYLHQFQLFISEALILKCQEESRSFFRKFCKKSNSDSRYYLDYDSWILALHDVAKQKYKFLLINSNQTDEAERFALLKRNHVVEYSRKRPVEDNLMKILALPKISALFQKRDHTLRKIYKHYEIVNFDTFVNGFCKAFHLVDDRVSPQIIEAFFEDYGSKKVHVLSFAEFVEIIGRLAVVKYLPSSCSGDVEDFILGKYFRTFPPCKVPKLPSLSVAIWCEQLQKPAPNLCEAEWIERSLSIKLPAIRKSMLSQNLKRASELDLIGIRYSDSERFRQRNIDWSNIDGRWMPTSRAIKLCLLNAQRDLRRNQRLQNNGGYEVDYELKRRLKHMDMKSKQREQFKQSTRNRISLQLKAGQLM